MNTKTVRNVILQPKLSHKVQIRVNKIYMYLNPLSAKSPVLGLHYNF